MSNKKRKLLILIFLVIFGNTAYASKNIKLNIIKNIESSGNPKAVSYKGAEYGRGLYQISEVCLEEWNNYHKNNQYTTQELFDIEINKKIAQWYLNVRIPQMIKYYGKDVSVRNILIAYNFGIGNLLKYLKGDIELPKETEEYIEKYERLLDTE